MGLLTGKRAVVVGASGGIGLACVRECLSCGAAVVGTYRSPREELNALAAEQPELHLVAMDLTDDEHVSTAMQEAAAELGGIDILINAAGMARPSLLHSAGTEEWQAVLEANVIGAFRVTRSVILPMMRAGGGSIVEVSSVYGNIGGAGQSSYSAAKAGVLGLTRSAAVELAAKHIRVNAVAPGFIDTAMTEKMTEKARKEALARIPMKCFGKPQDVAQLAVFLASDKAAYVTGQVFVVDGGLSAS